MLEILFLIYLTKEIGKMIAARGRKGAGWYKAMLVGMWFAGEIIGAICGAGVTNSLGGAYLFGLIGAAAGAVGAFLIVYSLTPVNVARPGFEVKAFSDEI